MVERSHVESFGDISTLSSVEVNTNENLRTIFTSRGKNVVKNCRPI